MAQVTRIIVFVVFAAQDGNRVAKITVGLKATVKGKEQSTTHDQENQRHSPQESGQGLQALCKCVHVVLRFMFGHC